MPVAQYSTDRDVHKIHKDKLDCIACHSGWTLNCKNCHLDTRKGAKPVFDEFYLGKASDGKIKTFVKMEAFYDNASHIINCFNPKNPGQNSFPVLTQEFKR